MASKARTRRSSGEIRELLVKTARDLFLEHGYERTTTKEISLLSGVAEPVLYGHFRSKADLFDAAVVSPFAEFLVDYVEDLRNAPDLSPEARVERFVGGLLQLARQNKTALLTTLTQRLNGRQDDDDLLGHVAASLQAARGTTDLDRYADVDPPALYSAALAMVFGVALLEDLIFPPGGRRPSRSRLQDEMTKLLFYGTTRRAAGWTEALSSRASDSTPLPRDDAV